MEKYSIFLFGIFIGYILNYILNYDSKNNKKKVDTNKFRPNLKPRFHY